MEGSRRGYRRRRVETSGTDAASRPPAAPESDTSVGTVANWTADTTLFANSGSVLTYATATTLVDDSGFPSTTAASGQAVIPNPVKAPTQKLIRASIAGARKIKANKIEVLVPDDSNFQRYLVLSKSPPMYLARN
jgi:hypothetical protein